MLSDEKIRKTLINEKDLASVCKRLIDMANEAGGKDNITVLIINYE